MNVKDFAVQLGNAVRDLDGVRTVYTDLAHDGAGLLVVADDGTRIYMNLVEVSIHPGLQGA